MQMAVLVVGQRRGMSWSGYAFNQAFRSHGDGIRGQPGVQASARISTRSSRTAYAVRGIGRFMPGHGLYRVGGDKRSLNRKPVFAFSIVYAL